MLNQILADVGSDIRAGHDAGKGFLEFWGGIFSTRRRATGISVIEQGLGKTVVIVFIAHSHRIKVVDIAWLRRIRLYLEGPAGKDASEVGNRILGVGRYQVAAIIQYQSAIRVHLVQADREQLENLACVVFIGSVFIVI